MGSPLGDFVRARRDSIQPEQLGLPDHGRRRAPGLRRSDLATRAGISVEYLTRIEQGRDRNPSLSVVNAIADALSLSIADRTHLHHLAKITGGACAGMRRPAPPDRTVRPGALAALRLLEPGIAVLTNGLGDVLAHTTGFALLTAGSGLLDADAPNLTRYVFTDPRARSFFPDWDAVADEQAFALWTGPSRDAVEWFSTDLAPTAGPEFTRRLHLHTPPPAATLRIHHPSGHDLRLDRETLDLSADAQRVTLYLPADEATADTLARLQADEPRTPHLRLVA